MSPLNRIEPTEGVRTKDGGEKKIKMAKIIWKTGWPPEGGRHMAGGVGPTDHRLECSLAEAPFSREEEERDRSIGVRAGGNLPFRPLLPGSSVSPEGRRSDAGSRLHGREAGGTDPRPAR